MSPGCVKCGLGSYGGMMTASDSGWFAVPGSHKEGGAGGAVAFLDIGGF